MDRLRSIEVFVAAADAGSYVAASGPLGISPQMVAKHIQALEEHLGVRLLNRTTRRQSLTEFGGRYRERCRGVLAELRAADALATEAQDDPQGLLRIGAPYNFGSHSLMAFVSSFLKKYSRMEVDLSLSDRFVNLTDEGFEAVFRIGDPRLENSSSLVCRSLRPYRLLCVAAPNYLQRWGIPRHPCDLVNHECLGYTFADQSTDKTWEFTKARRTYPARIRTRLRVNDTNAQVQAAINGCGIILGAEDLLTESLASGVLQRLLPEYEVPTKALSLIYPADRQQTLKMKTFINEVLSAYGSLSQS